MGGKHKGKGGCLMIVMPTLMFVAMIAGILVW